MAVSKNVYELAQERLELIFKEFLPGALLVGAVVYICLHDDSFFEALMRVQ